MFTLLVIFANSAFVVANADIVVRPRDTEAIIGESTYFDCASNAKSNDVNWYHYAVGAKEYEDICLYCLGRVHLRYKSTIEVERDNSTNNYRLRIKKVQRRDAGTYICEDNGGIGESAAAQLIILDSSPNCTSNMKPDGALGPNDCGLEQDTLQLSCHVSYHGNISPLMKWRKAGIESPIVPSFCQNTDNRMTCNVTMTVDLGLNGASYICETNRSTTTQYKCASDLIRVIYAKINNSTNEMTEGDEEKVHCSVNSSLSCSHTWIWFDGVHEEVVAYESELVAHKPGWHRCEVECNIRGKRCTVLSKLVHVSEPTRLSVRETIAVSLVAILTVELVIVGLVCIGFRKSTFAQRFWRRRYPTLLNDEYERDADVNQLSSTATTRAAKEKGLHIRGMAILGNELFVVTQRCSEVEVFDCNTLVSIRQWTLKKLIRPADMASCKRNRCLYIIDWEGASIRKDVLCVDPNGKLLRYWQTAEEYANSIFVTNEKNIILTCFGKNEFNEYSPEGIQIRKISLHGIDVPIHAIKITKDDFMVTNGDTYHVPHRVCIVGADGKVKKSFGDENGSNIEAMDYPMRLAVFADGSVAVLDNGNRRVLLLDKDLQFNRILLTEKMHKLKNPIRLLLDESNNRLLVVDNHNDIGTILVFQLKKFL